MEDSTWLCPYRLTMKYRSNILRIILLLRRRSLTLFSIFIGDYRRLEFGAPHTRIYITLTISINMALHDKWDHDVAPPRGYHPLPLTAFAHRLRLQKQLPQGARIMQTHLTHHRQPLEIRHRTQPNRGRIVEGLTLSRTIWLRNTS